ncbi:hypothetical protein LCGC14_0310660 [marine sediment metagenome]|uniref:Uncharacterized protein n=1 Tax=marine sediment metagenome TaxID=412755 RepID=A0A0F9WTT0_9ZZZZ
MVVKNKVKDPHAAAVDDPNEALPDFVPTSDEPPMSIEAAEAEQRQLNQPKIEVSPKPDLTKGREVAALAAMQQQIVQLQAELGSLRKVQGDEQKLKEAGQSGMPWQYYKRPDRGLMAGWVTTGPGGAAPGSGRRDVGSYVNYGSKGFKALTAYGVAPIPLGKGPPGSDFCPMLENGGAREFPLAQVIAYKWHVDPPISGLTFPSYEDRTDEVGRFICEDCDFEMYLMSGDRELSMVCLRHLRRPNRDGSHGYSRKEANSIIAEQGLKPPAGRAVKVAAQGELKGILEEEVDTRSE